METVIKYLFVMVIFTTSWLLQEQNQEWDRTRQLLKGANNFATHDAANAFAERDEEGRMVILQEQEAYEQFLSTMQDNLGLDENLAPQPGSPLSDEVRVIYFEIIDERTVTFPYLYENETYRVAKYLRGPAVFAVIETGHPQLTNWFSPLAIQIPAINEYVERD